MLSHPRCELTHYAAAAAAAAVSAISGQPNISVVLDQTQQTNTHDSMSRDQVSVTKPAGIDEERPRQMVEPMSKATGKVMCLTQLNAFCSEASIIGLRYVADQLASVFRRSIWILLLLAGAAFTAYQITS